MALEQANDSTKFLLYGVNVLLQCINERPITTDVELAEIEEAQLAASVLEEVKKEILSEGWDINTDDGFTFVQDAEGFISIPSNVLNITDSAGDIVLRDWRLYSKSAQSFKFTEPQKMNVIWDMDFNSLTHPIRNYIIKKAAYDFQARQVMDINVYRYTLQDVEMALMIARRGEGFTGQYNMLTSTYGTDNSVLG